MPGSPGWLDTTLNAIEQSGLGDTVRNTPYLYPILMSLHVLGIALLVGPIIGVDLRLLGVGRSNLPVTVVLRYLLPLARVGFVIVALTGALMFTAIANAVGSSAAAPWKFGLIVVAGINILIFHLKIYRNVTEWDIGVASPIQPKIAAVVSATSWTGVIFAGRFLAY